MMLAGSTCNMYFMNYVFVPRNNFKRQYEIPEI